MVCLSALAGVAGAADDPPIPGGLPRYFAPTYRSAMGAPLPYAIGLESLPLTIPAEGTAADPSGRIGFVSTTGAVKTAGTGENQFFVPTGTNGRSCGTCHNPFQGMSIAVTDIRKRFLRSGIKDPLFAAVDGADCPNLVPASETKPSRYYGRRLGRGRDSAKARSLILKDGLIRIFLPLPKNPNIPGGRDFDIAVVKDPTTCNTDPKYAFDPAVPSPTEEDRIISIYRRPLISANLGFKTKALGGGNIMWDGRDPNLTKQAEGAVMVHTQRDTRPPPDGQGEISDADIAEMVAYQENFFTAQQSDRRAGTLDADGATGGPQKLRDFFKVQGGNIIPSLASPPISPFNEYTAWVAPAPGAAFTRTQRESIQRGQALFEGRGAGAGPSGDGTRGRFTMAHVPGFNDVQPINTSPQANETCSGCHHAVHGGSSFVGAGGGQRNIGVNGDFAVGFPDDGEGNGGNDVAAPLRNDLPIFKVTCTSTPRFRKSNEILTNDPGQALITGRCTDLGRTTIPQLRALNAHLPLFHDGSANTVRDVVEFYNKRFSIGLTATDKADMTAFLENL